MPAKCFFQETLGTNKKECLQASVALDTSKGGFTNNLGSLCLWVLLLWFQNRIIWCCV